MKLQNINRILLFNESPGGSALTLEELQTRYGIDPDGTNFYYGLVQANVDNLQGGTAFNQYQQQFFTNLLASLAASPDDEKTLVLGVEPNETGDSSGPFGFVSKNISLVQQLATELDAMQSQALAGQKRLNIVIRYASEMNTTDKDNVYARNPTGFKSTFVQIRTAFQELAPRVLFSFSPGLRGDLDEGMIAQYWPGDQYVDVIGGTWYIGAPAQQQSSVANMRAYFLHRIGANKSFGIDELGGCNAANMGNDAVIQGMLHDLEALQLQRISFTYVTIFLASKWGTDATLSFLRGAT